MAPLSLSDIGHVTRAICGQLTEQLPVKNREQLQPELPAEIGVASVVHLLLLSYVLETIYIPLDDESSTSGSFLPREYVPSNFPESDIIEMDFW